MNRVIYACDVGSIAKKNFAWARVVPGTEKPYAHCDIDELVRHLSEDAKVGMSIALGFESPLFMPVPDKSKDLGRGREGDGDRAMFATSGATVTTLGIQEAAWVLKKLHDQAPETLRYTIDWRTWPPAENKQTLLLWEAFVSGAASSANMDKTGHEWDAATAAVFFRDNERILNSVNAVTAENSLCLVHAAAMYADWTQNVADLHRSCLVLKPQRPCEGDFGALISRPPPAFQD